MTTDVQIVNIGLVEIGAATITSLSGGLKRQEIANALYTPVRQALLSEKRWKFATFTQALARRPTTPANTRYQYAFAKPTDPLLLVVRSVIPNGDYAIEGDDVLANSDTLVMTYTADVDEDVMPPYFVWLLGLTMGAAMAMPLTKSEARFNRISDAAKDYRQIASTRDAQQQPNEPPADAPFVDARN